MELITALRIGGAAAAAGALAACSPSVNSLDCSRLATEAKQISADQPVQIREIRNVTEKMRNEREARCEGEATWSNDQQSPVYLKAYYAENGSTMVEYSNQPFDQPAQ